MLGIIFGISLIVACFVWLFTYSKFLSTRRSRDKWRKDAEQRKEFMSKFTAVSDQIDKKLTHLAKNVQNVAENSRTKIVGDALAIIDECKRREGNLHDWLRAFEDYLIIARRFHVKGPSLNSDYRVYLPKTDEESEDTKE